MDRKSSDKASICKRLRQARESAFGPRGRAALARALGLSPSTYIYYENNRVPPPDVLARAAEVTGVCLTWLITGEGPASATVEQVRSQASAALPAELQVALDRFIESSASAPSAAPAGRVSRGSRGSARSPGSQASPASPVSPATVQALAETLAELGQRFPAKRAAAWVPDRPTSTAGLIPILGRTAAGLPGTYEELLGEEPAVSVAAVARKVLGVDVTRRAAASLETDDPSLQQSLPEMSGAVALVQLSAPLPSGVVEFIDAPAIRARYAAAFAMRVDGESMLPRFRHGDVVIALAGHSVQPGQAALVQIRGRVGVTLKLVRFDGPAVHLVPINEKFDTERLPRDEIEWLAPVLYGLRV